MFVNICLCVVCAFVCVCVCIYIYAMFMFVCASLYVCVTNVNEPIANVRQEMCVEKQKEGDRGELDLVVNAYER